MTLLVQFGMEDSGEIVLWNKDFNDFPKLINKDGKIWEWFMYGPGDILIDYELKYSEFKSYNSSYLIAPIDWSDLAVIGEPACGCGKEKHGFANHMFYCPQWKKY